MSQDRTPIFILTAGFLLLAVSFGVRASYGVLLPEMTRDYGYLIADISMVLAIQNLMWGAMQPFAGRLADQFGTARMVIAGAILYGTGVIITALFQDIVIFGLSSGLLIGTAQAALGLPVLLGAIGRSVDTARRGLFLGIGTAGGSFGQLVFAFGSDQILKALGTMDSLLVMAVLCFLASLLGLVFLIKPKVATGAVPSPIQQAAPIRQLLSLAIKDRSFMLLNAGFFVCGFHVAFIGVHLPNYALVCGLPKDVGVQGLMIIGAFNIVGTILAGQIGSRWTPKIPLAWIYLLRALLTASLLFIPITHVTMLIFSALMGLLWLSTVPLTNLIVARQYGTANVGMLFGLVFFWHQVGSFTGLFLAGWFFDLYGDYDAMWIASTVLGVVAFVVHLPIDDKNRLQPVAA